jgi:hypothetical protein
VDEQGAPLRFGVIGFTRGVAAGFNRFKYYGSDGLYQPSVFWRRHAYFEVGGVDAGLRFAMDRDLETRLARRLTLGRIPDFLSASRVHSNTKTATLQKICAQEMELLMDRYGARNKARWKQALFYAWHRLDSLARKAAWITQKWFGVFRLERVYFPPEESGLTGAGK